MPIITEDELFNRLLGRCKASSQKEVANKFDVSPQFLNDVVAKKRGMGPKILKGLKAVPINMFSVDEGRWTKDKVKLLKNAWKEIKFEDIE